MWERARKAYAQANGSAAPWYGVAAALGIAVPLLAGALTGHAAQGAMVALGAYLVALRTPEGPYGARARDLGVGVVVVAVGSTVGGLLAENAWLAAGVVPPLIALGVAVPRIGPTAGLAVLLAAVRPRQPDVVLDVGLLELIGGAFVTALLLAPWPARRLRPLNTALCDAADAVAEALDAVAEHVDAPDPAPLDAVELTNPDLLAVTRLPDWEQRRRAASEALTAARTTFGLYRSDRGRDDPTRPERLIDALARVLHETVTLQAVVEAARNYPPDREWKMEAQTAISALAARLRLLAGAVATSGEAPLGGEESAAVRRMGRAAEGVRRAGLAGEEDLVAVALIGQVRRSIDRIAGEVASARRITAGGLRLGFGPPRLPEPHPATAWPRIRDAVATRSPRFRQVSRVFVTAVVSMALAAALGLSHGHWMTLTAMLSLRATYGETVERLVQRVGGTAAGSIVAAVLLTLAPGQFTVAAIVLLFAFAGFAMRSVNFSYWALFGTPLAMMLLDFSVPSDWRTAGERVGLTVAGALLAYLSVRLLWPAGHLERLPVQLGRLTGTHAALVRSTADVLAGEHVRLPHDVIVTAERAAEAVAETRDRLAQERVPDTELIARLRTAVRAAHRVRDHLIAVSRMSREAAVDTGPIPEILDRIADELEEAGAVLEDPPDRRDEGDAAAVEELREQLADLDDHLSTITRRRRAEIKSGVGRDEFTPLRHALLQVSGTRYAIRSLRRDAGRVVEASFAAAGRR
ncbi:FUSC family protein [Actinomadura sediminis]|uniref:FUSC family protein n=1 Tax=Actinomadura sediminis TaxID=1038904 RepID=A0ABW3EIT0_9ACTN